MIKKQGRNDYLKSKEITKLIVLLALTSSILVTCSINKRNKQLIEEERNKKSIKYIIDNQDKYHKILDKIEKHRKEEKQKRIKLEQERKRQEQIRKQKELEEKRKREEHWYDVKVTYYTSSYSDCQKTDGIGANNRRLSRGDCALPQEFPFGTKLYIEGLGVVENQDRGGAIHFIGNNTFVVDIFIPDASDKYISDLGVKWTKAKVIK
ncbi:hypothetical protein CGQ40_20495 (plasmid) [Clostridium botulinum]|nr:hypothetical protein CGQ40_20495 [Clostridium botulinum]